MCKFSINKETSILGTLNTYMDNGNDKSDDNSDDKGKLIEYKIRDINIVKENLGVNLGSIFLTERIVTLMRKKKTGRIIFTGSL
jgi:hypothetical protein